MWRGLRVQQAWCLCFRDGGGFRYTCEPHERRYAAARVERWNGMESLPESGVVRLLYDDGREVTVYTLLPLGRYRASMSNAERMYYPVGWLPGESNG